MTNIPTKKLNNGFEIPEYGLGTWQMGGRSERDLSNDDQADIKAINMAVKEGIVHIDTAESYANGHSEELIAQAIKENNINREDLFIVSKVSGSNQGYDGVLNACKKSLERLNTNYLDLYLLHRFPDGFSLEETMKALVELKDKGLVKNIGVSNFNVEHLKEAQSYSKYPIVCNQVHYNLRVREVEQIGLLKYCQENDIMIVAYRPTEKSKLFETTPKIIEDMCKKYNKTFAQISINWLISQPNVVTLAKTRDPKHLEENLGALGWQMEQEDIEKLRNEFPNQINVSDVVPLG
ncbi:MAG: aldo/keto reductase [Candidatus Nomurabacteria bacterium]|nr:aldo/keto reductase [Candidatus Nomurabacteria bacterium]